MGSFTFAEYFLTQFMEPSGLTSDDLIRELNTTSDAFFKFLNSPFESTLDSVVDRYFGLSDGYTAGMREEAILSQREAVAYDILHHDSEESISNYALV